MLLTRENLSEVGFPNGSGSECLPNLRSTLLCAWPADVIRIVKLPKRVTSNFRLDVPKSRRRLGSFKASLKGGRPVLHFASHPFQRPPSVFSFEKHKYLVDEARVN